MAVKYKIEFESNAGVRYRVDIYDPTYSGTPIALQGGATPFTTEEDSTDDFFAPIRTSTGTLNIVDDGSIPNLMEAIVPTNNVQKAVRLVRVESESESVEWQGFLSCEAYEQEFTDRTKEISINCNGILGALDSLHLQESEAGIKQIRFMIKAALDAAVSKGAEITRVHYPINGEQLLDKYIDSTVMYDEEEIPNENSVQYEPVSQSYKEVLTMIATFGGLCLREVGTEIYILRVGEYELQSTTLANFGTGTGATTDTDVSKVLDTLDWMGEGHTKSIASGAHSVKVIANLEGYKLGLALPECPNIDLVESEIETNETEYDEDLEHDVPIMFYMLYTLAGHQSVSFGTYRYEVRFNLNSRGDQVEYISYDHGAVVTRQDVIDRLVLVMGESAPACRMKDQVLAEELRAGAFLCKQVFEKYVLGRQWHDVKDALYCAFIPVYLWDTAHTLPTPHKIFTMAKAVPFACTTGYIRIFAKGSMIGNSVTREPETVSTKIRLQLKCGNHYWDEANNVWSSAAKIFELDFINGAILDNWDETLGVEQADGHFIRVNIPIYGKVELSIYDQIDAPNGTRMGGELRNFATEIIFEELGVDYSALINAKNNKRGENTYYRLLSLENLDDIEVNTDLATDMNNITSPSVVLEDAQGKNKTRLIPYADGALRPEQDLLERMATHYGAAKRKLTLQVEHPTEPLPLLRVTDGGKTYIPVAESRDYAADSSELTLLEV